MVKGKKTSQETKKDPLTLKDLEVFYGKVIAPRFQSIDQRFESIDRRFDEMNSHIDGLYKMFEEPKTEYYEERV